MRPYVLGPLLFLIYINDFHNSSDLFDFYHFADDSNLFYRHKNIIDLQANVNDELNHINTWLCANKLSLNIEKSNFVIFRPYQRKLPIDINLNIRGKTLKQVEQVKYLGVFIDSNLSCKIHVDHLAKKIRKSIGILSKMTYYTNIDILVRLYYALIYPFLIYALTTWENTYSTTLGPLVVPQKKAVRIITFSPLDEHSSPLFRHLQIIKLVDFVELFTGTFMYKYYNNLLPSNFSDLFTPVNQVHSHKTRLASKLSFSLPKTRTNYGIFNIPFQGAKIWNSLNDAIKKLSLTQFKSKLQSIFLDSY